MNEEPAVVKTDPILDLFAPESVSSSAAPPAQSGSNALDDLLSLGGNPFADVFTSAPSNTSMANGNIFGSATSQVPLTTQATGTNLWGSDFIAHSQPPFGSQTQPTFTSQPQSIPFSAGSAFSNVFNPAEPSVFDPLGGSDTSIPSTIKMYPTAAAAPPQRPPQPTKLLTGDLESSLTSLVENLTMDSGSRSSQWNSPKNQPKAPVTNWQPQGQPMVPTSISSYRPMAQPMSQSMMGQPMNMTAVQPQQPMNMMGNAPPSQPTSFDPFGSL